MNGLAGVYSLPVDGEIIARRFGVISCIGRGEFCRALSNQARALWEDHLKLAIQSEAKQCWWYR